MEAQEVASQLESEANDVVRAVTTWEGSDVAALVRGRGDIGPVSRLGHVVNINEFDAAGYVLVEVNLR